MAKTEPCNVSLPIGLKAIAVSNNVNISKSATRAVIGALARKGVKFGEKPTERLS